jgi:hypothetical protein
MAGPHSAAVDDFDLRGGLAQPRVMPPDSCTPAAQQCVLAPGAGLQASRTTQGRKRTWNA